MQFAVAFTLTAEFAVAIPLRAIPLTHVKGMNTFAVLAAQYHDNAEGVTPDWPW